MPAKKFSFAARSAPKRTNPFATLEQARPQQIPAKAAAPRDKLRLGRNKRSVRATAPAVEKFVSASVLSREEKRQIILAHARLQQPHDPAQVMTMWAGVIVCLAVVAAGWWWSVEPEIGRQFNNGVKPALAQTAASIKSFSEEVKQMSPDSVLGPLNQADAKLKELKAQVTAQKHAMAEISTLLNSATSSGAATTPGRDIFVPADKTSSSTREAGN